MDAGALAERVMWQCDALGAISEEAGRLTRPYGTPSMARASELVAGWMRAIGMDVRHDAVGNLIGRYEGAGPGARRLLLGSHLDTVRDAGKYDGPLGVLVALACVQRLHERGERLPLALEVVGFADEEGLRFHTSYLGSRALARGLDPAALSIRDADGVSLADAIRAFGGDPAALVAAPAAPGDILGYCEVHIEQGPVLEARGLPVGVVTAIAGQSRFALSFAGVAGHAGTVPMTLRRDALAAAAELVLAAEALARETPGLVATVGQLAAHPGASNVIPGLATLSLDVRHADDEVREGACGALAARAAAIAGQRGVELAWREVHAEASVSCDPWLSAVLGRAVERAGHPVVQLPSGAGHDGVMMSRLAPIAMLFVRCAGGVSHNPAESVAVEDVAAAITVMGHFLEELTAAPPG